MPLSPRTTKDGVIDLGSRRIRPKESQLIGSLLFTPAIFGRLLLFANRRGMTIREAADHLVEKSLDLFAI